MRYASAHSSFDCSSWPSIHDASPAVIERARAPDRRRPRGVRVEERGRVLAGGDVLAADVPVHERSPLSCMPVSQAAASPLRAAARSVSSAAWRLRSSAMPRSTDADLVGALDSVPDLAADLRVSAGVSECDSRVSPAASSRSSCVLGDRLQHPEPVALRVDLHERLVDERLELVEAALARLRADRLDVGDRAAAGEDGHPPEQPLLRLAQ